MLNKFYTTIIVLALAGTASTVSLAQDLALVITNGNYHSGQTSRAVAQRHADLIEEYRDNGYEVVQGRNMDAKAMRLAVINFYDRADGRDKVIVHFTGRAVHTDNQGWLLPVDIDGDSVVRVDYNAPSIDVLLGILGDHPGRGVMLLANLNPEDVTSPLMTGAGFTDIPPGVLLISGSENELNRFVLRDMFSSSTSIAETLARKGRGLQVEGFASPDLFLAGDPNDSDGNSNWVTLVAEQALWAVAEESGKAEDIKEYLDRFPNGIFAPVARARLEALNAASQTPQDIENALGLTRAERRKIQENLTVLGFSTRGVDGIFGRGSRTAIANWQREQGHAVTGYLRARQIRKLENQAEARRSEIRAEDRAFWNASGISGRENDLRLYLDKYPNGLFADKAKDQLAVIEAETYELADLDAWRRAFGQNTARSYRKYLRNFPDGTYAAIARQRLNALDPDDEDDTALNAAKEQEDRLNLNSGTRFLIENRLKSLGYNVGAIDGVFDARARAAIKAFQRSKGQAQTGYMNPNTVRSLLLG